MKNRKVIVTAFLLIAVMVIGVGYAAVSDVLNFSGNATISDGQVQHEFDLDIRITEVSDDKATWYAYTAGEAEINRPSDLIVDIGGVADDTQDSASFQIYTLTDAGESQVIWFKVENESAHAAKLTGTTITETGTGDHFTSAYTIYEADGTTVTDTLPAKSGDENGYVFIMLVITLDTTPSGVYQADFSFSIRADVE